MHYIFPAGMCNFVLQSIYIRPMQFTWIYSKQFLINSRMFVPQLLGWLAEKLPSCKKLPVEFRDCIQYLFASLEDRNADVRKKAHEAVLPFMIHTGYEVMAKEAAKAKVVLLLLCKLLVYMLVLLS